MVSWVKRILSLNRAGHSGTLDPKVTGVLPVMLGNATKIANVLLKAGKEYVCIMRLHQQESKGKIRKAAAEFVGTIYQRPPLRSSVKRRLRTRQIYYLDILEIDGQDVLFRVGCQAGTYIRKLCVSPSSFLFLQNGGIHQISDIVDSSLGVTNSNQFNLKTLETLSLSLNEHKVVSSSITGVQRLPAPSEMVELKLDSGIILIVTPDHEVLVDDINGPLLIDAEDLVPGNFLFSPRELILKSDRIPYLIELLDPDFLCIGNELKKLCKKSLSMSYGSVTKACRILGIDRRIFLQPERGIRIKYLRQVCEETELDWFSVCELIEAFKGERGAYYSITDKKLNSKLLYLLGLVASDGSIVQERKCVRPTRVIFTNTEIELIETFIAIVNRLFPSSNISQTKISKTVIVTVNNPVLAGIAKNLGITSPKKTMHLENLSSLSKNLISSFLSGYFDGDGTVSIKANSPYTQIAYETAYNHVAVQIFLLLKRLGIRSKIYDILTPTFDKSDSVLKYHVALKSPYDKIRFSKLMECKHPQKKKKLEQFDTRFSRYTSYGSQDLMPLSCVAHIKNIIQKYGLSQNSIYRGGAFNRLLSGQRPTRRLLSRLVKSLLALVPKDDFNLIELQRQMGANYFLDKIKTIKKTIPDFGHVYDITVDHFHNFALNGAAFVSNCYDIGEVLGGGAHMVELRRTRTGPFKEDANFISLYDLVDAFHFWQEDKDAGLLRRYIRPLEEGVRHLAQIIIRDSAVDAICHGANLAVIGVLQLHADIKPGDSLAIMTQKGELVALANALMSTKQILEAKSGIVADTARVVMSTGTYPTAWRRKS